jgi:hypothetical protein
MKLEQQVCSLELAQKLKELGVKQECSEYDAYWVNPGGRGWKLFFLETQEDPPTQTPYEWCRAFTVAELGEMLPFEIATDESRKLGHCGMSMQNGKWLAWWFGDGYSLEATTEADARVKMLIYLLENTLITL